MAVKTRLRNLEAKRGQRGKEWRSTVTCDDLHYWLEPAGVVNYRGALSVETFDPNNPPEGWKVLSWQDIQRIEAGGAVEFLVTRYTDDALASFVVKPNA